MDLLSNHSPASFHCEPLSQPKAKEVGERLLGLGQDQAWENWTLSNLLADRPDKWQLSCYAHCDGTPIGYAIASCTPDAQVHLHHLVVGMRWRGQGVGRRLLA